MENGKILGVKRNVFFLGLVSFFNDFSAEMVQAVMPIFITTVLGGSAFFVGLLEGTADAASSVLKVFSGWFSDKIRKRKGLAVFGYGLSIFFRFLLAAVRNFWQVFTLRLGDRIGKGLRDAPRDALIAESVSPEEMGRSYGFHRAADTLGATLGPLSAFFLLSFFHGNYRDLFLFASFLGLFAILSFVFVRETETHGIRRLPQPKLDWQIFKANKKFILIVFSVFIFSFGALPIGLVLLKAKEIGTIGEVPLMYFVYSLTFVLTSIPLGRLADKIGERKVIALGFLFAIAAYLGLAQTSRIALLALFFVILGIYAAATDGMLRMLAAKTVAKNLVATGQGFMNMSLGFSSLGAGLIGGTLWTQISSAAALTYAALLSFCGLVLFLLLSRK